MMNDNERYCEYEDPDPSALVKTQPRTQASSSVNPATPLAMSAPPSLPNPNPRLFRSVRVARKKNSEPPWRLVGFASVMVLATLVGGIWMMRSERSLETATPPPVASPAPPTLATPGTLAKEQAPPKDRIALDQGAQPAPSGNHRDELDAGEKATTGKATTGVQTGHKPPRKRAHLSASASPRQWNIKQKGHRSFKAFRRGEGRTRGSRPQSIKRPQEPRGFDPHGGALRPRPLKVTHTAFAGAGRAIRSQPC